MPCTRHPAAAAHRGHCPACLLEDALLGDSNTIAPAPEESRAALTIQLPLGHTASSSVFLAKSEGAPSRLLRLKTWHSRARPDFVTQFRRLQQQLSEWNDESVRAPLAAWVDGSRRPWVLTEFSQGMPIVDHVRSGRIDPALAEACLDRLSDIVRAGHLRGLVHGSIRSGNIIATPSCRGVYLLDFGQAALVTVQEEADYPPAADIAAFDRLRAAIREAISASPRL